MVESIFQQMVRQTEELVHQGKAQSDIQFQIEGLVTNGLNFFPKNNIFDQDTKEALQKCLGLMEYRIRYPYEAYAQAQANREYDYNYKPKSPMDISLSVRRFYRMFPKLHDEEFRTF